MTDADKEKDVVQGIVVQLAMYLESIIKLTAILDQENMQLLFEETEANALRNDGRQEAKQALFARVETLARIVTRTLKEGTSEDVQYIRAATQPVERFRRSLKLNSVLLELSIERNARRMERIMDVIERSNDLPDEDGPHVADHSL